MKINPKLEKKNKSIDYKSLSLLLTVNVILFSYRDDNVLVNKVNK
jgi:hypothetical protein